MDRSTLKDLAAFAAVARERSFSRAAAQLGVSPSALSHAVRALEERLGIRLLMRTTRSVAPTEAGERLLETVEPRFAEIDAELTALGDLRDKPAGTIRITATESAVDHVLLPALKGVLSDHPDINLEFVIDYGLSDIVAEQLDAGVRIGEQVDKDMIAVPISGDIRMAVGGSPEYLSRHGVPETPYELTDHNCINLRLPTMGGLYAWEFERDGREIRVRVDGQITLNSGPTILSAIKSGYGLGYLTEDELRPYFESGKLVQVLADWCPPFAGYHLYYPSRRQPTAAFKVLVEALRYRGN